MSTLRFDHIGVVVKDIDAAAPFFLGLGFESEGRMMLENDLVDRVNGLEGVRAEIMMLRAPDGSGKLELCTYHTPADTEGVHPAPPNRAGYRHICLEIDDLQGTVERLRSEGFDLVGKVQDYENVFRLCYVRGPEGMIVELAERLHSEH